MNILVTGGAGFIGSHIVDELVAEGHRVTVVDNVSSGSWEQVSKDAEQIELDIRSEKLEDVFKSHAFDIVFHEAAQTMVPYSMDHPEEDASINIMGLLNVLEGARRHGVRKVIFSSSAAVYGDNENVPICESEMPRPTSFYGLTKWMTEQYLEQYYKAFGLEYTVLRYSNVYGERQGIRGEGGVVFLFAKAITEGSGFTIFGDGTQTRDFIYVKDVAAANIAAMKALSSRGVYNISSNTELSVNALAEKIMAAAETTVPVSYQAGRLGDIYRSCLCNQKARLELGWQPSVSLEDGLKETYMYFKGGHSK